MMSGSGELLAMFKLCLFRGYVYLCYLVQVALFIFFLPGQIIGWNCFIRNEKEKLTKYKNCALFFLPQFFNSLLLLIKSWILRSSLFTAVVDFIFLVSCFSALHCCALQLCVDGWGIFNAFLGLAAIFNKMQICWGERRAKIFRTLKQHYNEFYRNFSSTQTKRITIKILQILVLPHNVIWKKCNNYRNTQ